MPKTLAEEISELISELSQLETQRDSYRRELDQLGIFSPLTTEVDRQRFQFKLQHLEDLNRQLDIERQKLISFQLASINEYSIRMNQNTERLNDAIKSLETTTKKSSTRLEYLTVLVILIAIINSAIILLTINSYFSVIVSVAGFVGLIQLYRRFRRDRLLK